MSSTTEDLPVISDSKIGEALEAAEHKGETQCVLNGWITETQKTRLYRSHRHMKITEEVTVHPFGKLKVEINKIILDWTKVVS